MWIMKEGRESASENSQSSLFRCPYTSPHKKGATRPANTYYRPPMWWELGPPVHGIQIRLLMSSLPSSSSSSARPPCFRGLSPGTTLRALVSLSVKMLTTTAKELPLIISDSQRRKLMFNEVKQFSSQEEAVFECGHKSCCSKVSHPLTMASL